MIRTDARTKCEELAGYTTVPVINGLRDLPQPFRTMADLLTVIEHRKALPGLEWAWLGDGNNGLHSIIEAAGLMKFNVRMGVPKGHEPDPSFADTARALGAKEIGRAHV